MGVILALWQALAAAAAMGWEILWPLVLGFALSGAIQAVVSHAQMSRLLPNAKARTLALAGLLGAASSSCSYAAVALARTIVRKGGDFTAAMAFQLASTNLVIELGLIMAVLLGWQFTLAEFVGGIIMIAVMSGLLRLLAKPPLIAAARQQAERGIAGRMEGHAAMDMAMEDGGSIWHKLVSPAGFTATSHFFVMDWASVWIDIALGLIIAGAIAAWVPPSFFHHLFLTANPAAAALWGLIVGPLIAMLSFVCSVGNVPLAAVLWNDGMSFGGVVSFIFADMIIIPILLIYRKYYGVHMTAVLAITMYVSMVIAGYLIELIFSLLRLIPSSHHVAVIVPGLSWNYTTALNLIFLALAAVLVVRFRRTGGPAMLAMMHKGDHSGHAHHTH